MLTSGCGAPAQTAAPGKTAAEAPKAETTTTAAPAETTAAPAEIDGGDDDSGAEAVGEKFTKSLKMSVDSSTGRMNISRAAGRNTSMGEKDTWSIFIYLCGTDLESEQGSATDDILQMLEAQASDNVRFIIQTGGTAEWQNNVMSACEAERYIVEDSDLFRLDPVPLKNMGSSDNLADFLEWGVENYPAEKMGVVFWDHGGGSISGVCFDELNESDSLSLQEINTAFSKVYEKMTDKFEFIGFDCCLMGTIETANILASYARYFFGSEEIEPGSGWDYTSIGNFLAENPGANGGELGRTVADSFYAECESVGQESGCTFSIIDLGKLDDLVIAFNDCAKELYEAAESDMAGIVRQDRPDLLHLR